MMDKIIRIKDEGGSQACSRNSAVVSLHTSSRLVMTEGLLLDSVSADTGVLSPFLPVPDTELTTVVGVNDMDVATVLVFEMALTDEVCVVETDDNTVLVLEAGSSAAVLGDDPELDEIVVVLEEETTVLLDTEETEVIVAVDVALLTGIFFKMSSLAFHPS